MVTGGVAFANSRRVSLYTMELETRSSKRIKLDDTDEAVFDDPTLQRRASDVCSSGLAGDGFLSGTVFMTWAPASMRLRFIMETEETSDYGATNKQKFTVIFTGACSDFFGDLTLRGRDEIALSLKGARVESQEEPSRSCTLAMRLLYESGVIMFKKRAPTGSDTGKITNTWKCTYRNLGFSLFHKTDPKYHRIGSIHRRRRVTLFTS